MNGIVISSYICHEECRKARDVADRRRQSEAMGLRLDCPGQDPWAAAGILFDCPACGWSEFVDRSSQTEVVPASDPLLGDEDCALPWTSERSGGR